MANEAASLKNSADSALVNGRAANPVGSDDFATKAWAEENIGSSGVVYSSNDAVSDVETLPSTIPVGNLYILDKTSPYQMTRDLRITPASGHKILINGSVVENPGYIQVKDPAKGFALIGLNSTTWGVLNPAAVKASFNLVERDTWVSKTAMSTARYALATFSINGYGYNSCGFSGAVSNVTEQYNDMLNSWSTKTVNPTARHSPAGFSLNGFGYIVCGFTGAVSAVTTKYNDSANSWATMTVNPTARYGTSGATLNGYGYASCGHNSAVHTSYNDALNTWTTQTAHPTSRYLPAEYSLNGYLYVTCGDTADTSAGSNTHTQYNGSANTWTSKTVNPTSRNALGGGFSMSGYGYATCGGGSVASAGTSTASHTSYNDFLNTWTAKTNNPAAKQMIGAMTLNGYGFISGGRNSAGTIVATNDQYN